MARNWMNEADQEAKKYSDAIKQSNQYLVDQLAQNRQNSLNQIDEQQKNTIYNLNADKASINQNTVNNAKQLNVARLMSLKDNQNYMNRAGLGTQGIVGSQVNSINNEYGTNLTNLLNQQTSDLRNNEKQKQNALLTYNTNRLNTDTEYGNNLANLKSQIEDKARAQYNTIYNQYLAQKQQEYADEQAELARQEAIRQYNEQMAFQKAQYDQNMALKREQFEYQKQQDALANQLAQQQLAARYYSGGGGNSNSYTSDYTDYDEPQQNNPRVVTDYYDGYMNDSQVAAINKYGAFNTQDKNGVKYQPAGVVYDGQDFGKISKAKINGQPIKAGEWTADNNFTNSSGVNVANQNVWVTDNGQAWIWNGSKMTYEPIGGYKTRLVAA